MVAFTTTQTWKDSSKGLKAIRTTMAGKLSWEGDSPLTFPREALIELAKTSARTKILKCMHALPMVQKKDTLESDEIRVVSSLSSHIVASNWVTAFRETFIGELLGSLKPLKP